MSEGTFDAARLRELGEQSGLQWKTIAERAGVSTNYLHEIVSGRIKSPGVNHVAAVARALGVSPLALIGYSEDDAYRAGWQEGVLSCVHELQALRRRGPA